MYFLYNNTKNAITTKQTFTCAFVMGFVAVGDPSIGNDDAVSAVPAIWFILGTIIGAVNFGISVVVVGGRRTTPPEGGIVSIGEAVAVVVAPPGSWLVWLGGGRLVAVAVGGSIGGGPPAAATENVKTGRFSCDANKQF